LTEHIIIHACHASNVSFSVPFQAFGTNIHLIQQRKPDYKSTASDVEHRKLFPAQTPDVTDHRKPDTISMQTSTPPTTMIQHLLLCSSANLTTSFVPFLEIPLLMIDRCHSNLRNQWALASATNINADLSVFTHDII